MSTRPLFVPLRAKFFEAFEAGAKSEEFRPYGPRWNERTCPVGRPVVLSYGYGKARRLRGVVVSFRVITDPAQLPIGWRECYGDRHATACAIGVDVIRDPQP